MSHPIESITRVLVELASGTGLNVPEGELEEILRRTDPGDEGSSTDWLLAAAEQIRLRVTKSSRTVESLLGELDPELAFVGWINGRWVSLRQGTGNRALVTFLDPESGDRSENVGPRQVANAMGIAAGTEVEWMAADPAVPCELASSPPSSPIGKLGPLRRLARLLRPDRGDLWAILIFAVATGVLLLAIPIAVQAMVNFVAFGSAIPSLVVVAALLFVGLAFAAALTITQTWIVEILQRRIFVRMVADLAARLPRVTLAGRGHGYGPELVNRFFDVVTIQKVGSALLLDGLSMLLSVLVGLVILAFYHPILLAFDVLLLVIIAVLVLGPARRGIASAIKESKSKYAVAAWLEEITRNPLVFKTAGAQRWVNLKSDRLTRDYVNRRREHYRIVFGQVVGALSLQALASTALLAIGGFLVIQGSLTLGQLVAAELIVTMVVSSVAKMGKHVEGFYDLMAAVDKVGQLLDLPTESMEGEHPPAETGAASLELDGVSWGPSGRRSLIHQLTVSVPAGGSLGITGDSGSGKSKLMELLWGLRDPDHGIIRLDGRDVRDLAPESLRRMVSLTSHHDTVAGTVRENIRLGRDYVGDDEVRWALHKTDLEHCGVLKGHGLDQMVEPDGYPLSVGEMQSLAIARALAARPRLLLFDAAFSQLSHEELQKILDTLFDPSMEWTLVIASNVPEVLERCDQVLHLPDGNLTPGSALSRGVSV